MEGEIGGKGKGEQRKGDSEERKESRIERGRQNRREVTALCFWSWNRLG